MEEGEGADHLADADEEERGEGWGHQEAVQGRHQVFLDLQTQLGRVQERKLEVVPGAEYQDVRRAHRAVLEQVVFILTLFICRYSKWTAFIERFPTGFTDFTKNWPSCENHSYKQICSRVAQTRDLKLVAFTYFLEDFTAT